MSLFLGAMGVSNRVLAEKSEDGIKQGLSMYCQPKDSVDVVMLGSSHVHCGINTATLWEEYGIPGYDYSSAEQQIWVSYYLLREFCKYQNPKVVVLDFFSPAAFLEGYKYQNYYLDECLYGMRFSANKLEMMGACFGTDTALWDKYFPAYFGYHDRYDELTEEDMRALTGYDDYVAFKGFTPFFYKAKLETPSVSSSAIKPPSDKSVDYFERIVRFTKDRGIQLYITIVPYELNVEQEEGVTQEEEMRYNWLEQVELPALREQGYDNVYFDYVLRDHLADTGIKYGNGKHFADGNSHLNYYGSQVFTRYLAADLRNRYSLSDHRGEGEDKYSSWDEHVSQIHERAKSEGWE